jgi:drug/metabolite transporter (DMT)-like permease
MGFLFIILGTLMWSLDTLVRYPLLALIKPDTMVLIEHFFLVLILGSILFLRQFQFKKFYQNMKPSDCRAFIIIGALGSALSTLAFTKAFSLISPSLVILLQKLQPLVVISLSSLVLKEKLKPTFFFYLLLAIFGGVLISLPDIAPLLQTPWVSLSEINPDVLMGYTLTLVAVLGWGASTVYGKKLSLQGFSAIEIMTGRFTLGFIFLLFYCTANQNLPSPALTGGIYTKILLMVLVSGLCGMYLYYRGLKLLPAHVGAIAELFFPVSAVLINWYFLGIALQPLQIVGAVILTAASIGIQYRKL